MSDQSDGSPSGGEMDDEGPAVVANVDRPTMDEAGEMSEADEMPPVEETESVSDFATPPFDDEPAFGAMSHDAEPADTSDTPMEPPTGPSAQASDPSEGYIRLTVQVANGEMSVIDAVAIDGPLQQEGELSGAMAYQVLLDGRRVAGDGFDEMDVERGIAPEDDPTLGHHVVELDTFEYTVRIDRAALDVQDLDRLEIELLRPGSTTDLEENFSADQPIIAMGDEPAAATEVVARMSSLDLSALDDSTADEIRRGLGA